MCYWCKAAADLVNFEGNRLDTEIAVGRICETAKSANQKLFCQHTVKSIKNYFEEKDNENMRSSLELCQSLGVC